MIEVEYDRPHIDVIPNNNKRSRDRDGDRVMHRVRHKVGKETSVHTCVWATIAPSVSVVGAGMVRLLSDWWRGLNPVTPVAHVAFVPADVGAVIINNPKSVVKVEETMLFSLDLDSTPLLVFHTLPLPGKNEFHVLGALLAKDVMQRTTKMQLKDLRRDAHTLDARSHVVHQGVQEKRDGEWWWFRMPTEMWTDMFGRMPGGDPSEHVDYRLALMCAFWKQRDNVVFESEGGHGDQMLRYLHTSNGGDAFFNMWTDEGRDVDVAGFWGLFLVCAQDVQLWDPWRHWERRLLEFRVREYLCKEKHFVTFLSHNDKLFSRKHQEEEEEDDDEDAEDAAAYERECEDALECGLFVPRAREDVDERDIQLYRMRHPRGPLPKLWYQVRASDMGPAIMGNIAYDVECGRVLVTHRDFVTWAWHHMEALTSHAMKEWRFSRLYQHSRIMRKIPIHIRIMMRDGLQDATRELNLVKEGTSISSTTGLERQYTGGEVRQLEDATSRDALLQLARTRLPPCMAQHVWEAFSNGRHPENFSRVSLSMFLLSAGYGVKEADNVIYMLYGADAALIDKKYNGTWTESGYKRENGGNVKNLKRSLDAKKTSPYGCESLVGFGGEGKFHGCPFAKRNTAMSAQPQIISLLQWSGCSDVDIEDIMRPAQFPQQKCERLLLKRNPAIPSAKSVVKHPNHFFRMSQQQQQKEGL